MGVALARFGEQGEMGARRGGVVVFGDGQLDAGDGADATQFELLGKFHRAVEAVVVGQRDGAIAQLLGGLR